MKFQVEGQSDSTDCVLVVDDEELVRWALKQRLEERGYRVLEAPDARGAADLGARADLVLVEEELPDGRGADLAAHLRGEMARRPLILMTAYSSPEMEQLVRDGTVEAIVEKPFGLDDVLDLIGQCLRGEKPGAGG